MPKIHFVLKARKGISKFKIRKGQPYYYWWTPKPIGSRGVRGVKRCSRTPPKQSQMATSPYKRQWWQVVERLQDMCTTARAEGWSANLVREMLRRHADQFRYMADGCREALRDMNNGLKNSRPGILTESRIEQCLVAAGRVEDAVRDMSGASVAEVRGILDALQFQPPE